MLKIKKSLLQCQIIVLFICLVARPLFSASWRLPITIKSSEAAFVRTIGGAPEASDGYDAGLDVLTPPPPGSGIYAHLQLADFPNYLDTDIRQWTEPFSDSIKWSLRISSGEDSLCQIKWHPSLLPALKGAFFLMIDTQMGLIDMRTDSLVTITGNTELSIVYRFYSILEIAATEGGETDPLSGIHYYDFATTVVLNATPDSGYEFVQWTGDSTTTTYELSIVMNKHWNLAAEFKKQTPPKVYNESQAPAKLVLYPNLPNPFNPSTRLSYSIPNTTFVALQIYNILGEHVITLVNKGQAAGFYEVAWEGRDKNGQFVPNGIYLSILTTNKGVQSRKMVLAR